MLFRRTAGRRWFPETLPFERVRPGLREWSAEKRPADYTELRAALLPYSPAVPSPAPIGRRLLASVIDSALLAVAVTLPITALKVALLGTFDVFAGENLLKPIASQKARTS